MSIVKILKEPYPISNSKWRIILPVSLFVSLFLLIFQPFGLQHYSSENKLLVIGGYGLVTMLILIVNLIILGNIFSSFFSEKNWNLGKQIVWQLWLLVTIGLANFAYSILVIPSIRSGGFSILFFLIITIIIGIIPITFLTIIQENKLLKKHIQLAQQASKGIITQTKSDIGNMERFEILGENQSEKISLAINELLCIESEGNYVSIFYRNDNGYRKTLIRATLKNMDEQLHDQPSLFRCHRAYIVNLLKVEDIKGNAQGYRLKLSGMDNAIPVSRGYIRAFNEAINSN